MVKSKNEKQLMEALISPHGQIILEFLEDCGEDKMEKLMVAEGNELYRTQGAVQELKEIVKLAYNARNILHS